MYNIHLTHSVQETHYKIIEIDPINTNTSR